jgi:hypothetical protein
VDFGIDFFERAIQTGFTSLKELSLFSYADSQQLRDRKEWNLFAAAERKTKGKKCNKMLGEKNLNAAGQGLLERMTKARPALSFVCEPGVKAGA